MILAIYSEIQDAQLEITYLNEFLYLRPSGKFDLVLDGALSNGGPSYGNFIYLLFEESDKFQVGSYSPKQIREDSSWNKEAYYSFVELSDDTVEVEPELGSRTVLKLRETAAATGVWGLPNKARLVLITMAVSGGIATGESVYFRIGCQVGRPYQAGPFGLERVMRIRNLRAYPPNLMPDDVTTWISPRLIPVHKFRAWVRLIPRYRFVSMNPAAIPDKDKGAEYVKLEKQNFHAEEFRYDLTFAVQWFEWLRRNERWIALLLALGAMVIAVATYWRPLFHWFSGRMSIP